jgi:hypothetical protein
LSQYVGEQAVISQGVLWTHRIDRHAATTDSQGTKHIPVKLVCLGPVHALGPSRQREKTGLGQRAAEGNKSRDFVLNGNASRPSDHLESEEGNSDTPLGRPQIRLDDALILKLAGEGQGVKAIARSLRRQGQMVSHMTVARRLTKLRRRGLDGSGIGLDRRPSYKSLVHNKETYFAIGTPLDRLRANG